MARPVTTTGYNTFGEVAESQDPDGNITTYAYDADGRQVSQTLPSYTQPGGSSPVNGTSTDARTTRSARSPPQTDPDGNTTHVRLRPARQPTGQTDPDGGVTTTAYDADGEQLSQTGPTGAQTTATYDYLGRQLTATDVERYPSPAVLHDHDVVRGHDGGPERDLEVLGDLPGRGGHQLRVRRGRGDDPGHRRRRQHHPVLLRRPRPADRHRQPRRHLHHRHLRPGREQGRPVQPRRLRARPSPPRARPTTARASQLSTTDALGDTTAYTYDPAGGLTAETQPVTSSAGIVTSFGYDAAGNQTRYTDGNGNNWITTYNSRDLPETQVEPATSQYSTAAELHDHHRLQRRREAGVGDRARRGHRHRHLRQHERPDRPVRVRGHRRDRDPVVHLRRRPGTCSPPRPPARRRAGSRPTRPARRSPTTTAACR